MIGHQGVNFGHPALTLAEAASFTQYSETWGLPRQPARYEARRAQRVNRKADNRRRSKAARQARRAHRG